MKSTGAEKVLAQIGEDRDLLAFVVEVAELLARRTAKKGRRTIKRHLTR